MYRMCAFVSGADDGYPPYLYPAVTPDRLIIPEPDDGAIITRFATKILVEVSLPGQEPTKLCEFSEIRADVIVTESRLLFRCDRFDTGRTYGGLTAADTVVGLAMTAVSKLRARGRNQDLALVGQIRYPWLQSIGGFEMRLLGNLLVATAATATDKGALTYKLTLFLTRGSGPIALADQIGRLAASHDLKHEVVPAEAVSQLTALAEGRTAAVKNPKAGTTGHVMPWAKEVAEA